MKNRVVMLAVILAIGLFFRLYHLEENFTFNHDQDLYSWIVKDIVVNHHQRLVGQITSVDGVFIGSLFYYIMALAYWLGGMNPISAVAPLTAIGLASVVSMYWVGLKSFGWKVGMVGSFLYACSWGLAAYDRWSVPTQPTMLWSIWFLFLCLAMLRGEIKWLPLYALLAGLIWQIHIAFLPLLPLPILAFAMSRGSWVQKIQKLRLKNIAMAVLLFGIVSLPFWLFEIKHNFSQIRSIVAATQTVYVGPTGMGKFNKVVDASTRELQQRLVEGYDRFGYHYWWIAFLLISIFLIWTKKVEVKALLVVWLWIGLVSLVQFWSKKPISEYYFSNLVPPTLMIISVFLSTLFDRKLGALLAGGVMFSYLAINTVWMQSRSVSTESLLVRKQLVEYIKKDADSKKLPCIGVNYVADFGKGVGFRYIFWDAGVKVVKPGAKVPTYNILIPWQINVDDVEEKFGRFGVIKPPKDQKVDQSYCDDTANQLDPMLGYVD